MPHHGMHSADRQKDRQVSLRNDDGAQKRYAFSNHMISTKRCLILRRTFSGTFPRMISMMAALVYGKSFHNNIVTPLPEHAAG